VNNWKIRIIGVFILLTMAWYLPWLFNNLNLDAFWLSIPFAIASIMTALMILITVINHWTSRVPDLHPLPEGETHDVAIIIPTYGEPTDMVYRTARSVLEQNYVQERIHLIISDDGHRFAIREIVAQLQQAYPAADIFYFEPPLRGDPQRHGEAKAGNLNAAFDFIKGWDQPPDFIETRDADDLIGNPDFLRQAIGQLEHDPALAFVQTIKEAHVDEGDPFGNLEPLFYRKAMLARNAANAVFPCGSGLVWRREALEDIGGFPVWNLVEDLQSGVEALRRDWRGTYLPIVGAIGQTAPEDIPNVIKQRGTWALDTMRLTFWGDKSGLNLRQHLQFAELGFFYMLSFAVLVFAITPVFSLIFDVYPLITTQTKYALHFWPHALAVELLLIALADGLPYEDLWRARQTWLGLAPVYLKAMFIAILYGPNRKPTYRVTRKEHVHRLYLREILPQLVLVLTLIGGSIYHILTKSLLITADLGSLFWAAFFVVGLSRTVRNAWYGVALREHFFGRARRIAFLRGFLSIFGSD
jgi:cellulose synthase (UDP-forming)